VSSMRLVSPVTHGTLLNVISHVRESPRRDSPCFTSAVPLQYVYTAELSQPLFIKVSGHG